MDAKPWQRVLVSFEPTTWRVTLKSGDIVVIYADSHSVEDGADVFSVLVAGQPPTLETVARVPTNIVQDLASDVGLAEPED
jgi:hypothetical protein